MNGLITQAPDKWFWAGIPASLSDNATAWETAGWLDNDSPLHKNSSMIPKSTVASLYAQGDYEITDDIGFFAEFMHSKRNTTSNNVRQFFTSGNPLDPYFPLHEFDGWETSNPALGVMPVALTDHFGNDTTIDYTRFVVGLEGSLGYWLWEASWQRTLNAGVYKSDIIFADSYMMAHEHQLGLNDCTGVTEFSGKQCIALDWMDPNFLAGTGYAAGVQDFLFGNERGKTTYKQDTFEAYITGDLFDLPAGPVATAVGYSYQTDFLLDTPGEHTLNGNSWGLTGAGITTGRGTTNAAFAEVQIPVIRYVPFIESFDITASGRHTRVSTYGSGNTYKLGANWKIGNGLSVRAQRGTSFRAPALYELFLDKQTGFSGQTIDPCLNWVESSNPLIKENCAAAGVPEDYIVAKGGSMTVVSGGGAGQLDAETSVSKGIGLVYTSPANAFAASVDYYDILISDQVSNIGGSTVLANCYTTEHGIDNEPFCTQIDRRTGTEANNWDWGVDEVRGGYLNTSSQHVRGLDFVVSYQTDTPIGHLRLRLNHTNQIERTFKQFEDSEPTQYVRRLGNPKHTGNLNASLQREGWGFNWNIQYVDKVSNYHLYTDGNETTYFGEDVHFVAHSGRYFMHSVSANKRFDSFDITFGISNLFDRLPAQGSPAAVNTAGNTMLFTSQYDLLGRRAFANMSFNF